MFPSQFDDQGTLRQKAAALVDDGSIQFLLRHLGEGAAQLRIVHFGQEISGQRDPQLLRRFAIR
jgi:hypothetical protein